MQSRAPHFTHPCLLYHNKQLSDDVAARKRSNLFLARETFTPYGGRSLTPAEKRYGIMQMELLSLIHCLKEYRTYFINSKLEVVTDHLSLKYLKNDALRAER
jgi:hypothetical protein